MFAQKMLSSVADRPLGASDFLPAAASTTAAPAA